MSLAADIILMSDERRFQQHLMAAPFFFFLVHGLKDHRQAATKRPGFRCDRSAWWSASHPNDGGIFLRFRRRPWWFRARSWSARRPRRRLLTAAEQCEIRCGGGWPAGSGDGGTEAGATGDQTPRQKQGGDEGELSRRGGRVLRAGVTRDTKKQLGSIFEEKRNKRRIHADGFSKGQQQDLSQGEMGDSS